MIFYERLSQIILFTMFLNLFVICHTTNLEFLHDLKPTSVLKQPIRSMVEMLFKYNELLERGLNLNSNLKKTLTKNYLKIKNGLQHFKNENQQNSQTLNMIMSEIIAKRKDTSDLNKLQLDQETKLHKPFKWG